MDKSLSDRLTLASLISAAMVVMIHCPQAERATVMGAVESFLSGEVCRVAVPYFFCAAGYLFALRDAEPHWYRTGFLKRMRTVLLPYLIWCAVYGIFYFVIGTAANLLHHEPLTRNLLPLDFLFGLDPFRSPAVVQFWFLRALVVILALGWPLVWLVRRGSGVGLATLALLFYADLSVSRLGDPAWHCFFDAFVSVHGLFYFCAGAYLARFPIRLSRVSAVLLLVLGLLSLYGSFKVAAECLTPCARFLSGRWLHAVGVLATLSGGWRLLPAVALPSCFRPLAFPIYLLHGLILSILSLPLKVLVPNYPLGNMFFVVWLVSVVASACGGLLLMRFAPRFSHWAFGGRVV